jgi:hypothetical protein
MAMAFSGAAGAMALLMLALFFFLCLQALHAGMCGLSMENRSS